MEFGNIGNYYILEPLIRGLHKTFPNAIIKTTFQLSDEFCNRELVQVLPLELYYAWNDNDLSNAKKELEIAEIYNETGKLAEETAYIKEVLASDLVIDFSGDIWGDNADFLGDHRFYVGLCKDRVAQLLNKPTAMIAGSPGPFSNNKNLEFAKEVYTHFDFVSNREPVSMSVLNNYGFDTSKTYSLACPSFLFEGDQEFSFTKFLKNENIKLNKNRPKAGFIICGWNFEVGPFDKWPRRDNEYESFADAILYMIDELGMDVFLMSHSNGFPIPPADFKLHHGRDYPIIKQLQKVLQNKGVDQHLYSVDDVYNAWETKTIIGNFDFLVSGRVHGAIAGLSQTVPTVIIDYGHEPKAHKLVGFAQSINVEEYVADPSTSEGLIKKIKNCWINHSQVKNQIRHRLISTKKLVHKNYDLLKQLVSGNE